MIRRALSFMLLAMSIVAGLAATAWYATARDRAAREYRLGAERFYTAVAAVGKDLRVEGAGDDARLARAQWMAVSRNESLEVRDRQRASEADLQAALGWYATSAGNWSLAMDSALELRQRKLLDDATAAQTKGDELVARARQELDAGK
jgi:hypothetical protein